MLFNAFQEYVGSPDWRDNLPEVRSVIELVGQRVQTSNRYILDRPATLMVQNMTTMLPSQYLKTLPLCRLRHQRMWVEFLFRDRLEWLQEATRRGRYRIKTSPLEAQPQRLGFLLEETETDKGRTILAQPAWLHPSDQIDIDVAFKAFEIYTDPEFRPDPDRLSDARRMYSEASMLERMPFLKKPGEREAAAQLSVRLEAVIPDYWEPAWEQARKSREALAVFEHSAEYDLASEWRFILSLLVIMNSRNLIAYGQEATFDKLNKKRAQGKKPKPPLLSHRTITLNLSKVQKRRLVAHALGQSRKSPEEPYWVEGHMKVRKSGVFWWSPHERLGEGAPTRTIHVTA
jgi:hypothetical protein